ncbi:hypothetical protein EW146_g4867 [Bondarzewia mesenterica]|uniref:General stress protein FMN-binding split barrel domain-containing protein n=1 Tax=Bondarzewia mesenterica TaxID=1095465 RepID=A0A4S4LU82_9AGAM|nr:hypothetical protein EW146_g4867 [Bondarzewia mesenterica]
MTTNPELDPYTAAAQSTHVSPQEKIADLHKIVEAAKTGMLTTRASNGHLHARAMNPAGPVSPTQLNLVFIVNNTSPKCHEVQNDSHVNVSFYDASTTDWASFSGRARIVEDRAFIKTHWSPKLSAYFNDLGDGVHKGDENDPRVCAIEVAPDEIRYWIATSGAIGRTVQAAVASVTGKVTVPSGELREMTEAEIKLTQEL